MLLINTLYLTTILFSLIAFWQKPEWNKFTKWLTLLHFVLLLLSVTAVVMLIWDYKFVGQYTNTLIAISCLLTGLLLFGFTKKAILKLYTGFLLLCTLFFEILLLFNPTGLILPFILLGLIFQSPKQVVKVNAESQLEIYEQFMGPPPVYLTQNKMRLFKKQYAMHVSSGAFVVSDSLSVIAAPDLDHIVCCFYVGKDSCIKDTLVRK